MNAIIAHRPTCPISDPELKYQPLEGRPKCGCDFAKRLGDHLLQGGQYYRCLHGNVHANGTLCECRSGGIPISS